MASKLNANQIELGKFYKPYLSDEEDDSSQDSYNSDSESESGASSVASLPPPPSQTRQNAFVSSGAPISSGGEKPPEQLTDPTQMFKQTKTAFTGSKNTTTIMINSSDRDTKTFPQPTFFTLRLPRTYRNVVGISVTQIKMLSSFYYFAAAKMNTSLRIQESGRTKTVDGKTVDNPISVYIRDGTYDAGSLISELNNQLNRTPIYNRISFADFTSGFITTGNFSPLFNDPGDTTYNPVTGIFEALASKADLTARYFKSGGNLGLQYYSSNETMVAYYYPMLKDLTIGQLSTVTALPESPFTKRCTTYVESGTKTYDSLNYYKTDATAQSYLVGTNFYDRIVYGFQGLDDPYITYVLSDPANRAILQKYKDDNTWDGYLVNKYVCSYDSTVGRMTIYSAGLNSSLVTTLNAQYQDILVRELVKQGITTDQVAGLQTLGENYNGVIIDMYNTIQRSFTNYFAVSYGNFAPIFYTNLDHELDLADASGRYGWNLTYSGGSQLLANDVTYPDASGYWPRLSFIPEGFTVSGEDLYYPITYLDDLPGGGKPKARYTYTYNPVSDASNNLILYEANEESLGYQDISFNIMPTAYTRVKFKSRCRQQIFIEAIPPFKNELPPNNKPSETYILSPNQTPLLFNDKYGNDCKLDPIAPDFIFFDISQNMFDGPQFMRDYVPAVQGQRFQYFIREEKPIPTPSSSLLVPSGYIGLYTFRPHVFFKIKHGAYLVPHNYGDTDTKFRSDIYIEREDSQAFGTDLDFYWYRSRAAYMADVSNALINPLATPRPKHYFLHAAIAPDVSSARITTDFISYQSSYCMIQANGTLFPNQTLRIFVLKHDPYGVYTYPSPADYRQMPIDMNYLKTKKTPITNFPTPYSTLFNSKTFRNTYDLSGVSNNLLDHFVITTDFSHYDPYDFTDNTTIAESPLRFTFQFKTKAIGPPVGTSAWSQYYFNGSSNAIFDTKTGKEYYNSTVAAAEIANGGLKGISNEFIFSNWFSAGANNNLYKTTLSPLSIPEQTIATVPSDLNDPTSLFTALAPIQYPETSWLGDPGRSIVSGTLNYKLSPFIICKNSVNINTDISFNDLNGHFNQRQIYLGQDTDPSGVNIKEIMAIPFTPPMGRYILPKRVVLKFAYIQPVYTTNGTTVGRTTSVGTNIRTPFRYQTQSTSSLYGSPSEDNLMWDDHYWQNRRNVVLGIYRTRDIMGVNVNTISPANALCTLTLKKVVQIGQYTGSTDPNIANTRNRTPEWGTYYVYTMDSTPSNMWFSWGLETDSPDEKGPTGVPRWAAIAKPADLSGNIFMKNYSVGDDLKSYYSDVSNNSLCFIPFAPVLSASEKGDSQDRSTTVAPFTKSISDNTAWEVGSFNGLTYTTRPYLPITRSQTLAENPYIFYDPGTGPEAVCVEEVGNDAISMGDTSTYLGVAGPFCLGKEAGGTVVSPNYRKNVAFTPTFFNVRINLNISDTLYNPLFDMTKFGGYDQASLCYVDTQTYFYDISKNPTSALKDINTAWGAEKASRFIRYDDDSGFNYLSYMPTVNLTANHVYQLNMRGYVPTVKFLSGVRIVGKNWTDFGRISFNNLINEIALINNAGIIIQSDGRLSNDTARLKLFFTYDYTRTLLLFDKQFTGSFVFGRGIINPSYPGVNVVSTGFGDFMRQFIAFNTNIKDLVNGITSASSAALTAVRKYIATNYSGILPDVVLQRNRFTDPLTYSIQFKSALKDPYTTAYDQWGLGWNLGFDKIDTIYNTRHVAITFIRIVDDYIYLKLDDELNINNIDISYKEDLSQSRDTAGQSKRYYGKLLLNSFGSFAQTFIQSAKAFTIPIGRLDKLTFQLVDAYNRQLSNNDCEYNIVLGIDEMVDTVDTASIVVKGT